MVFKRETTVSSEKFWEELCCPPGRFFTKLGIACLPIALRRKECVQGKQAKSSYEELRLYLTTLITENAGTVHRNQLHSATGLSRQKSMDLE